MVGAKVPIEPAAASISIYLRIVAFLHRNPRAS
jgi:hypothetical protein